MGIADRLRGKRDRALAEPRYLYLEIPGYGDPTEMVVRYKPLDWVKYDEEHQASLLAEVADDAKAKLAANLDSIIEACDALMTRKPDGKLVSLADEIRAEGAEVATETGEIRYDHEAVKALGLGDLTEAREIALAVFDTAVLAEAEIERHAGAIGKWMQARSREVDQQLGEASGGTTPST